MTERINAFVPGPRIRIDGHPNRAAQWAQLCRQVGAVGCVRCSRASTADNAA